jgi:hypothetical protein
MATLVRAAGPTVGERATHHQMIIIGWSEARDRGEIYRISGFDDEGLEAGLALCGDLIGAPGAFGSDASGNRLQHAAERR